MSNLSKLGFNALVACAALSFAGMESARAASVDISDTFNLSQCEGATYCGANTNWGTAALQITGSNTSHETVTITVTLNTAGGVLADPQDATIAFDLTGNVNPGGITASSNDPWDIYPIVAGWYGVFGPTEVDADEPNQPGQGFGQFNYGVTCYDDITGTCVTTATITLTGSNLGLGSNSNGLFLAIDTQVGDPAQGAVAALAATPLPGTLPLFASAMGVLFLGFWTRRRSTTAKLAC